MNPCLLSPCSSRPFAAIITVVRSLSAGIMAGATFIFAWLAYASLFVSQAQAGWEILSPGDIPRDVVRRQSPPNPDGPRTVIDAGFGRHHIEHIISPKYVC